MSIIRKLARERSRERYFRYAVDRDVNPFGALRDALRKECGFDRHPGQSNRDYYARAAGVSRETLDRYTAVMHSGGRVPSEFAELHAFADRVGRRMSGVPVS